MVRSPENLIELGMNFSSQSRLRYSLTSPNFVICAGLPKISVESQSRQKVESPMELSLEDEINGIKIFGSIKADVYTVEFQKRGLPHAHIILWLSESDKIRSSFEVDQLISVEIPDKLEDLELYELVGSYMVHGPCGRSSRSAPCMKDGKKDFGKFVSVDSQLEGWVIVHQLKENYIIFVCCLQEFVGQRIMKTSELLISVVFPTFRKACFALGLLDDDKEYIDAIKEASSWVGVPVMLIRNIDQAAGMCNGTRLQISQLGKNVIKAKALNGTSIGEEILIHRMDMNPSKQNCLSI
ncbi:hypothetical protein K1719_002859 [Acacia pycnantha]|nr:hypothetical protein K1719_002859 [Acacia pycnantha]